MDPSGALFVGTNPINLAMANLRGADLIHASLAVIAKGANLGGANLAGANPLWMDFSESNLSRANLNGANLSSADFSGADFTGADLTQAELANVDLSGSNLSGAILRNADLSGANLRFADLTNADLTGSNFRDANLTGANLRLANLEWADLTGSELGNANLTGANRVDTKGVQGRSTGFQVISTEKIKSVIGGEVDIAIERILCPVDFSEVSIKDYLYAQSIARRYRAKLILQHVVESRQHQSCSQFETLICDIKLHLRNFVDQYGEVEPECLVEESAAAAESILPLAPARAVSFTVMGTNGWCGINHLLSGSVTESVQCTRPVPRWPSTKRVLMRKTTTVWRLTLFESGRFSAALTSRQTQNGF